MADEKLRILIDANSSKAVAALDETDRALLKLGSAADQAKEGVNGYAARLDALKTAQSATQGSAQELATAFGRSEAAAAAAGGKLGGLNQRLLNLKDATAHVAPLHAELNRLAGTALKAGAAITGIGLALAGAAIKGGVEAAAERLAIEDGLKSIMGSADAATAHLNDLKEASRLPGVNLEGAIKMSVGLQSVEVDADLATRAVKAVGNALALRGGSEEQFDQASRALGKLAGSAKLSSEYIQQLNEAGLPTAKILRDAFGTADPEQLAKLGITGREAFEAIVASAEKLPAALGGPKNDLENLQIALGELKVGFGKGLLGAKPDAGLKDLTARLEELEPSLRKLGEALRPVLLAGVRLAEILTANDGLLLKVGGTLAATVGPVLLVGGAIAKVSLIAKEVAGVMELVGLKTAATGAASQVAAAGGLTALQTGLVTAATASKKFLTSLATHPIFLTIAALAALGYELSQLKRSYDEMREAAEQAAQSRENTRDAFEQAGATGWQAEEAITGAKAPRNAAGRTPREQALFDQRQAAAKTGGESLLARERGARPASDASFFETIRRPEVQQYRREVADALRERDDRQREAVLDAIRGRR